MKLEKITLERVPHPTEAGVQVARLSIELRVVHHSPTGIEWGYGGSGPADAALNILHLFAPPGWDGKPHVNLYRGRCSKFAWDAHQDFKREFIATMPREGGELSRGEIVGWIRERWPEYTPPG